MERAVIKRLTENDNLCGYQVKHLLLIHPSKKVLGKKDSLYARESLTPSLGLGYIASFCRAKGIEVKIIDLRLRHRSINDIFDYIKQKRPVVGITAFTNEITAAGKIAEEIKALYPDVFVVVGGPHSSVMPSDTLAEFPFFDCAVIGEGEETMQELITKSVHGLSEVNGIAYRKGKDVVITSPREPSKDLDLRPFPAWDLFEIEHYTGPFMISSSRGCPYPCYFCTPNYLGKVRIRNPIKVVDELERDVKDFGAKRFQFADATLSLLEENIYTLCDEIIKREINTKIEWDCETRADKINKKILEKMKEAGCKCVALGVETGSERILKDVVRKGETKEDIRKAVKLIKESGLNVRCFFIIGHYTETIDTIKETIDFAIELNPDGLSFGLMVPNPGSKIYQIAQKGEGGLRILHRRWEDYNQFNFSCLESDSLPLDELKKWQSRAYFVFYARHPIKGLRLFFDSSGYNYNIGAIFKIPLMLIFNFLGVKRREK